MVRSLLQLAKVSRLALVMLGFGSLVSHNVLAQSGDVEAGKQKAVACASCHGQQGISASPDFPHLAGQVPGYIAAQLAKFKSGERANAIMQGMSAALSDEDMADLDAFYVSLDANKGSVTPEQEEQALEGEKIYRGGYEPYMIAACMGHGRSANSAHQISNAPMDPNVPGALRTKPTPNNVTQSTSGSDLRKVLVPRCCDQRPV